MLCRDGLSHGGIIVTVRFEMLTAAKHRIDKRIIRAGCVDRWRLIPAIWEQEGCWECQASLGYI